MKIREKPIALAAALAIVTWGCGDDAGLDVGWIGTMEDSAGVVLVKNGPQGLWSDDDRWTVREELRIGAVEDPDYEFGQVAGIGVLSDGRLVVLDQQAQHLKLFSPAGELIQTVGGAGSGPGEFGMSAGPVLVGRGDTIFVPDLLNQRVNRFAPDGSSHGSYRLDFGQGIPLAWQDDEAGTVASQVRQFDLPGQPAADSMDAIVIRAPDGTTIDTLMTLASGRTFAMSGDRQEITFFAPEPAWALIGDGRLVSGVNDTYRLTVRDARGAPERVITKPFEPIPVTEADESLYVEALMRLWEGLGVPPQTLQLLRETVHFAEFLPAYAQIRGGPGGSIWVQRPIVAADLSPEERESFNPQVDLGAGRWDVFDREGRYLGPIDLPRRYQPLKLEGERIFGVWRDDLDVQYVLVLRIQVSGDQIG